LRPSERPQNSGFTLVELVIILVILGIIGGMAVGRFSDLDSFHARGFFDETLGALRYAQKLAVATGCEVQVQLQSTPPAGFALYQRSVGCASGAFSLPVIHSAKGAPFAAQAPAGIPFSATEPSLVFDAMGRALLPSGASTATLSMGAFTAEIVSESGLVRAL